MNLDMQGIQPFLKQKLTRKPRKDPMKHLILVIAILTAVAAQAQQPGNCLKLKKVKIDHHMLHQQDETVAQLTFKARNCSLLTGREKPDFTFADEPGLFVGVKDIRFGEADENAAGRTKEMSVSVKLIASVSLPVGEHELRGIVKYQAVGSAGTITPESLAITIPFKVAPPKPPEKPN